MIFQFFPSLDQFFYSDKTNPTPFNFGRRGQMTQIRQPFPAQAQFEPISHYGLHFVFFPLQNGATILYIKKKIARSIKSIESTEYRMRKGTYNCTEINGVSTILSICFGDKNTSGQLSNQFSNSLRLKQVIRFRSATLKSISEETKSIRPQELTSMIHIA